MLYAKTVGAQIDVLHIVETLAVENTLQENVRAIGARVVTGLATLGEQHGVRVESHVKVSRSAGRAVLAAAQENQADLIVLGAIPRLLGRRMFLGNTVEFVLHHAACAVALFIPAARRAGTA